MVYPSLDHKEDPHNKNLTTVTRCTMLAVVCGRCHWARVNWLVTASTSVATSCAEREPFSYKVASTTVFSRWGGSKHTLLAACSAWTQHRTLTAFLETSSSRMSATGDMKCIYALNFCMQTHTVNWSTQVRDTAPNSPYAGLTVATAGLKQHQSLLNHLGITHMEPTYKHRHERTTINDSTHNSTRGLPHSV